MPIIRKEEAFPERPVIIAIYGMPGTGKTSLSNTAEMPILVDCDRGAYRACNRVDTIIASKWKDVLAEEHEFKNYKTGIFDTAKAILDDYLMQHVIEVDSRLGKNKLKAYGEIGNQFKDFINRRRSETMDIIITAHAKVEKEGEVTTYYPDVTGQSKDLILRIADQVGFVSIVNKKRVITFEPDDTHIGKNVARIPATVIPDENDPAYKTFMADIIAKVKKSIRAQSEEQVKAQKEMSDFELMVGSCESSDDLVALFDVVAKMKEFQKAAARKLIPARATELGLKYNPETKIFESCTQSE